MSIAAPIVELTIEGEVLDISLSDVLRDFTYSDACHGKTDDLSFEIADPDGRWRRGWLLDEGTRVSARVGYIRGLMVPCGEFIVDQPSMRFGPDGDTASFAGLSASTTDELRTKRSAPYDDMKLEEILQQIARRHDYELVFRGPDLRFKRITQNKQSDLAFMTRLADDYGCYFTIKGQQVFFIQREEIENAEPARVLDLIDEGPVKSCELRQSSHECYGAAEMAYLNPQTGKEITVRREDPRIKSGDTLKIDDRAESQAHAEEICKARLSRANDGWRGGSMTLAGDPSLLAGLVIELGVSFGAYAGRWLIVESTHSFAGQGYSTTLELKGISHA